MKGIIFNKPLEFALETTGESWMQGSTVQGKLTITNHGEVEAEVNAIGCMMSVADIKKVHSKDPKAFNEISKFLIADQKIQPKETITLELEFKLDANCPVTDKKESLYLSFGKNCLDGNLQLNIKPQTIFIKTIEMLTTFYSFKFKGTKNTKKGLEFKFDAPESKDYTLVDQLNLTIKTDEASSLFLDFAFIGKTMDLGAVTTKFKTEEKKFSTALTTKEYLFGKDLINQDKMLKAIEEVIVQVKGKGLV
jgi:hypothetical protein